MALYILRWTNPGTTGDVEDFAVVTSLKEARRVAREQTCKGVGDVVEISRVEAVVPVPVPREVA